MSKIQAIIYDLDGTLLDTREYIINAFEQTLEEHGYPKLGRNELNSHVGKSLRSIYEAVAPDADHDRLIATHATHQVDTSLIRIYENLHALLVANSSKHQAVVTSRHRMIHDNLDEFELAKYFDVIVGGDDVEIHKPHPEGILKVLKLVNVAPESTIMIGDSTADIGAAKNANLAYAIGVTHGFGVEDDLVSAGADHIVHDLNQLIELVASLDSL